MTLIVEKYHILTGENEFTVDDFNIGWTDRILKEHSMNMFHGIDVRHQSDLDNLLDIRNSVKDFVAKNFKVHGRFEIDTQLIPIHSKLTTDEMIYFVNVLAADAARVFLESGITIRFIQEEE